jgi:polyribonucleotide nucleotidyltransferase
VLAEPPDRSALDAKVRERAETKLAAALRVTKKDERYTAIAEIEKEVIKSFVEPYRSERVSLDTLDAFEGRREGCAASRMT